MRIRPPDCLPSSAEHESKPTRTHDSYTTSGDAINWNAALNINNLTDRTYYQTMGDAGGGNWYGEPRSFMLTLRGSFN